MSPIFGVRNGKSFTAGSLDISGFDSVRKLAGGKIYGS
jgi:hypothetical protein